MDILSTGTNFLLILFGFGFLIFVHELGHFLAARWANIRVDCFAIGMGPTLFSWRSGVGFRAGSTDRDLHARFGKVGAQMSEAELARHGLGETEYTFRLLPIGGYVRMLGQEDANPAAVSDAPRSYQRCPIGKRMVVVCAGVVMNLIAAVVLFWIAFAVGVQFPAPVVAGAMRGSPAQRAVAENAAEAGLPSDAPTGLLPGDRVRTIDGEPAATFADIALSAAMAKPGRALTLTVERPGVETPLRFVMTPEKDERDGLLKIGVGSGPALSGTITAVEESQADVIKMLAASGVPQLVPGATLVEANGRPVSTYDELDLVIDRANGSTIETTWTTTDGGRLTVPLTPKPVLDQIVVSSLGDMLGISGLLGLTPLLEIESAVKEGVNADRFQSGDVVVRIGDIDAPNYADLRLAAQSAADEGSIPVTVLRNGQEVTINATVTKAGKLDVRVAWATQLPRIAQPISTELVLPATDATASASSTATGETKPVERVPMATPVADFKLFGGSTIVDVAGSPITDWPGFRAALRSATSDAYASKSGATVDVTFAAPLVDAPRETKTITLSADQVRSLHALGWTVPLPPTIFDPSFVTLKATGPVNAIWMGFHETKKMVLQVYLTLDRLIRGSIGVDKLNGPVGIFHLGVQVADQGFMFLIFFVAMLSVNLAVMNFLPLPIVDGGLFLFLVYEKLVGRPPSIGFQNAATAVGLLLIGSIFLITFFNDVARLIG